MSKLWMTAPPTAVNPATQTALDAKAASLVPTAVKTSAYTAAAGDFVPCDTTSGGFTVTLPAAPADKTQVALKHVIQGGSNAVTFACGGSDVFNKAGGATSGTLSLLGQAVWLQYRASSGIWYVLADDIPLSQLDLRFQGLDATLTALAALATGNNKAPYSTGTDTFGQYDLTAFARTLLGVADAATARTTLGVSATADIQVFTSSGTWTKPTGCTKVTVVGQGAGAGAGSGARQPSGTATSGGAGGGSGGYGSLVFRASDFGATEPVTIGAGGTGGASATANGTNGNVGTAGGVTSFGSPQRFRCGGGNGGAAGATSTSTGGASNDGPSHGGVNGASGTVGAAGTTPGTGWTGGPGASGGGVSATPAAFAGGTGGTAGPSSSSGGTAGAINSNGGNGVDVATGMVLGGSGGGGGGSSITGVGGNGGNGGNYCAGGGGGGSSLNGFNSGAGGNGGPGIIVVISE